jgi:hypothetical protein
VNRGLFVDRLIVPAYAQGLARWLIEARVEVKLFGRGWGETEALAAHHAGEICDRAALAAAAASCAGLVYAWPANGAHPIDAMGRPVLRRGFKRREMWIAEARRLARGGARARVRENAFSASSIMAALGARRVLDTVGKPTG